MIVNIMKVTLLFIIQLLHTKMMKEMNMFINLAKDIVKNLYRTKIGEQVDLIYKENRPHRAKEKNVVKLNNLNLILLFLGFCIFFYSLLEVFG